MKRRNKKNLGIQLRPVTSKGTHGQNLIEQLIKCFVIWMVMVVMYQGIFSVFPIKVNAWILYGGLLFIIAVLVLFYSNCKRKWIILGAAAIAYGGLFVRGLEVVKITSGQLMELYLNIRNAYLVPGSGSIDLKSYTIYDRSGEIAWVILMLTMIIVVALTLIIIYDKYKVIAAILMLLPVILASTVGEMPSSSYWWMMLLAGGLYFSVANKKESKKLVFQGIVTSLLLIVMLLAATWIQPTLVMTRTKYEKEYYNIKAVLQKDVYEQFTTLANMVYWDGNFISAGVGKGNLKNLSSNHSTGKTDLEVVVEAKPTGAIYLKGYVGGKYTQDAWVETTDQDLKALTKDWKTKNPGNAIFSMPYDKVVLALEEYAPALYDHMQIKRIGANKEFSYMPYFSNLNADMKVVGDGYVKGKQKDLYGIEYFPYSENAPFSFTGDVREPKYWDEYQDYVVKTYTQYPKFLTELKGLCSNLSDDSDTFERQMDEILESTTVYDLSPGAKPEDIDFAEYFLFQNKKGFCVHYATTAVLMYRMKGIPARYVGGYVIAPSSFVVQADGSYKAKVTDAMAHAWAEVYEPDYGWMVREHTKGYENINSELFSQEVSAQPSTKPEDSQKDTPQEEQLLEEQKKQEEEKRLEEQKKQEEAQKLLEEKKQKEEKRQEKVSNTFEKWKKTLQDNGILHGVVLLLEVIVGVLFLIGLFLLQAGIRRERRRQSFLNRAHNSGICQMYKAMYDICVMAGAKKKEPLSLEMLEQMIKVYPNMDVQTWLHVQEYTTRAMYGNGLLTKEEQAYMYHAYQLLAKEARANMNARKRFSFRYIHCFG